MGRASGRGPTPLPRPDTASGDCRPQRLPRRALHHDPTDPTRGRTRHGRWHARRVRTLARQPDARSQGAVPHANHAVVRRADGGGMQSAHARLGMQLDRETPPSRRTTSGSRNTGTLHQRRAWKQAFFVARIARARPQGSLRLERRDARTSRRTRLLVPGSSFSRRWAGTSPEKRRLQRGGQPTRTSFPSGSCSVNTRIPKFE